MAHNEYTEADDIAIYEKKYNEELLCGMGLREKTQFEYAWSLVQSRYDEDRRRGVLLLEELLKNNDDRDYLYYLALGYYRTSRYSDAQVTIGRLLQREPANKQAQLLRDDIDKAMAQDGLLGVGVVGSIAAVAAIGLYNLLKR